LTHSVCLQSIRNEFVPDLHNFIGLCVHKVCRVIDLSEDSDNFEKFECKRHSIKHRPQKIPTKGLQEDCGVNLFSLVGYFLQDFLLFINIGWYRRKLFRSNWNNFKSPKKPLKCRFNSVAKRERFKAIFIVKLPQNFQ